MDNKAPIEITESSLFGVSIRAYLVFMIVCTVCIRELLIVGNAIYQGQPIGKLEEPFYGAIFIALSWYFGQKKDAKQP